MTKQSNLLALEDVETIILNSLGHRTLHKTVRLEDSLGCILAEDVIAPISVPPYDNSAMDGYGFVHRDLKQGEAYKIVAQCFAGHPVEVDLQPGECIRILTGAPVPDCVDTVIMQENITLQDDHAIPNKWVECGTAIRLRGEDIAQGSSVFSKGHRLTAVDLGVLASLGVASVVAVRLPMIAVFSTGDELVSIGGELAQGQIYDSNRLAILSSLKEAGFQTLDLGIVPDDPRKIRRLVEHADTYADIVITSGGVSVGDADYTGEVLAEYGSLEFWKLAIKPGKPLAFGTLPKSVFFGLPGNPVSAMVTLQRIVIPLVLKAAGLNQSELKVKAKAAQPFKKRPGRVDFQRGIYQMDESGFSVQPTGPQGSGMLSSVARANCFVVLERERGDVEPGEWVDLILR